MKINCNNIGTGWPDRVDTTLRRRISAYIRNDSPFKIGITCDPRQRAKGYGSQYDEMIVLYKTASKKFVDRMETNLIAKYQAYCDNSISGGGGRKGYPPYYLYIVRST